MTRKYITRYCMGWSLHLLILSLRLFVESINVLSEQQQHEILKKFVRHSLVVILMKIAIYIGIDLYFMMAQKFPMELKLG